MLKLNLDPQFTADFQVTVPGVKTPETITLTCKYRTSEQLDEFTVGSKKETTNVDFVKQTVIGWGGIDEPFTAENLEKFLKAYPASSGEIVAQYYDLSLGSRVKN